MAARINYEKVAPGAIQAMRKVEEYVRDSGLERSLLELVKLRASEMNGCAYSAYEACDPSCQRDSDG